MRGGIAIGGMFLFVRFELAVCETMLCRQVVVGETTEDKCGAKVGDLSLGRFDVEGGKTRVALSR